MKSTFGVLTCLLLMVSFGISHGGIPFTDANEEIVVHVNVLNAEDRDRDDLRVRAFLYERELARSDAFDIDDNSNTPQLLYLQKPQGLEPDYYPIRVVIRDDDDLNIVKHVWTYIE